MLLTWLSIEIQLSRRLRLVKATCFSHHKLTRFLDLQNEPHDVAATSVFSVMQAAVNSIRAAGATSQLILVEGQFKWNQTFKFCLPNCL